MRATSLGIFVQNYLGYATNMYLFFLMKKPPITKIPPCTHLGKQSGSAIFSYDGIDRIRFAGQRVYSQSQPVHRPPEEGYICG